MQFSFITTAVVTALATAVSADNCFKGFDYCGAELLNAGDYLFTIQQALHDAGLPTDDLHIKNTLFACEADGWIATRNFCDKGCHQSGSGSQKNDFCN